MKTKEELREYMREYRKTHPEYVKRAAERIKERLANDPELQEKKRAYFREYNKAYYQREGVRERKNARQRERYHSDPDYRNKVIEYSKQWKDKHPGAVQESWERYWKRRLGLLPKLK